MRRDDTRDRSRGRRAVHVLAEAGQAVGGLLLVGIGVGILTGQILACALIGLGAGLTVGAFLSARYKNGS